jgi:hypothetical protein
MNIDGNYKLNLDTPLGNQDGTLTLKTQGAALSGTLANARGTTEFSGGTVNGGEVAFDTRIATPIGHLKAHVTGTISGDRFTGDAKLPLGSAHIDGVRT